MIEILYPIALTWAEARKYATYNFETGVCTWNKLPRFLFESDAECDEWNFANFGKPAGKMTDSGYFSITIPNHGTVSLHRFIWFVVTSECPEIIDHINHDKADNRWENLRNVTAKENSRNRSKHSNNTS